MKLEDVSPKNLFSITHTAGVVRSKLFSFSLPEQTAANVAIWILLLVCPEALTQAARERSR